MTKMLFNIFCDLSCYHETQIWAYLYDGEFDYTHLFRYISCNVSS